MTSDLFGIVPVPPPMKDQSRVNDLQARLEWGEPALTIIDVRDRADFNISHIRGAISMPKSVLVQHARESLELNRDIYVYGETDEETAEVAALLRKTGFQRVSELRGGLPAWKAVGYPIEAIVERSA